MRLIDADELRNELSNKDYITYTYEYGDAIPVDWVIGAIDNAPTVEITEEQAIDKLHDTGWLPLHDKEMTERPRGEWIKYNSYFRKCSLCQKVVGFDYIEQEGEVFNFCPNCGADMRTGGEDA